MKTFILIFLCEMLLVSISHSQDADNNNQARKAIHNLIDDYSEARESKDTDLLDRILADDIDQLVSSGTWRIGKKEARAGMMQSSTSNPGERTLTIDKLRFLDPTTALVDCRYEIQNPDGATRKMWSTFIVIYSEDSWKITAIRNMLPAR
jgi:uncharacterized protein (TIGR02246 family)